MCCEAGGAVRNAEQAGKGKAIRKVSSFIGNFAEAVTHLRSSATTTVHWVLTTGNRTAAGLTVPFDAICKDLVVNLAASQSHRCVDNFLTNGCRRAIPKVR